MSAHGKFLSYSSWPCADENYYSFQSHTTSDDRSAAKFDKNTRHGGPTAKVPNAHDDIRATPTDRWKFCSSRGMCSRSVQLRLPPHRAGHHSYPRRKRISFCAYNPVVGGATLSRKAHDGHDHQVVRGGTAGMNLPRAQEGEDGVDEHTLMRAKIVPGHPARPDSKAVRKRRARKRPRSRRKTKRKPLHDARCAFIRRVVLKRSRSFGGGFIPLTASSGGERWYCPAPKIEVDEPVAGDYVL